MSQKPGYKTTEFYLSLCALVCGTIMASGAVSDTGTIAKICGGVLSVLAALGYTVSRTVVKSTDVLRRD
jgi:hypothetical protein